MAPPAVTNVGFLTILQEPTGTVGGYLVTNSWGRPLEFRLSSAVQPNRVQQILYGDALPSFLCGELIGKTLVEKSMSPVQWVITDHPHALDLRLRVEFPVVLLSPTVPQGLPAIGRNLYANARFEDDVPRVQEFLETMGTMDLGEPFNRIREAVAEARKMGVSRTTQALPGAAAA